MKRRDNVDIACEQWAGVMRELVGLRDPDHAHGFLGPMRCTLAARRDLHHGSRTQRPEQHWPEFPFARIPEAKIVNTVYWRMPAPLAEILVAHYVVISPRDKRVRAELMGISTRHYWERLGRAKAVIQGALLAQPETVRTYSPPLSGISRMPEPATG